MPMTPKTIFLDLSFSRVTQQIQEHVKVGLLNIIFGNLKIQTNETFEKTRAEKSLGSVLSDLGKLEYEINIYKKT